MRQAVMRRPMAANRSNRSQKRKRRKSNQKSKQIRNRSIAALLESKSRSQSSRSNRRVRSRSRILPRRLLALTCMSSPRSTFALAKSSGLKRIRIVKSCTMRKLTLAMERNAQLQVACRKISQSKACRISFAS